MPLAVEPLAIIARFAFDGILSVIHSYTRCILGIYIVYKCIMN